MLVQCLGRLGSSNIRAGNGAGHQPLFLRNCSTSSSEGTTACDQPLPDSPLLDSLGGLTLGRKNDQRLSSFPLRPTLVSLVFEYYHEQPLPDFAFLETLQTLNQIHGRYLQQRSI